MAAISLPVKMRHSWLTGSRSAKLKRSASGSFAKTSRVPLSFDVLIANDLYDKRKKRSSISLPEHLNLPLD